MRADRRYARPVTWHWDREPVESTREFVETAIFTPTPKGLQAAIEVIAYPDGHAQVVTSRISGPSGKRTIVQGKPLMFRNVEEAKDAVDLILDRLSDAAAKRQATDVAGRPE